MTCRGGLTWWEEFLIVGCYVHDEDREEVNLCVNLTYSYIFIVGNLRCLGCL